MSLDRPHLQLLIAVQEHGQLGAAARALNISASAASHRMREAERRSGLSLIEQHGRIVRLTAAGRHLAETASAVELQLLEAETVAGLLADGRRPRVRMALDFYDAAPWITELVMHDGSTPIDVVRVTATGALTALRERLVDLVVIPVGAAPAGVRITHLCSDHLVALVPVTTVLAGPTKRPIGPLEFADQPYLAASFDPQAGFEFREFFAPAGRSPDRIVRIESLRMILSIIANGSGVSIQPSLATPNTTDVRVHPLEGRPIEIQWIACTLDLPSTDISAVIDRISVALTS